MTKNFDKNLKQNICTFFKSHYEVLFLLFILILSSVPLINSGFEYGVDTRFHMNRIEGILTEVRAHHFPVRISGYFMHGYGYPTSIYYGDILLYFPALLRYIGFSVTNAYKAYILFINLLTVLISYFSFKKISSSQNAAILGTMAYNLSTIRLMDIYIRGAAGEYSAMTFLPLIAVGIWMIYEDANTESKVGCKRFLPSLLLAIGMSGVIETHIITTETVVIALIIVVLVFFKKTFTWKVIKQYIMAVLLTVLINFGFIIPFFDYFLNENVMVTNGVANAEPIQFGGVYLYQYFMFFMYPYGSNTVDVHLRLATIPGMLLTIGLIAVFVVLFAGKINTGKSNLKVVIAATEADNSNVRKIITPLAIVSLFILFISSNLFPWDFISEHMGTLGKLLVQIQYPWRFISVAVIFMTIVIFLTYNLLNERIKRIVMISATGISVLTMAVFTAQYYHGANIVYYEDESSLWVDEVGMGEYLKVGNDRDSVVGMGNDILTENVVTVEELEHRGSDYKIHIVTGNHDGFVNMPVFNYKGYCVIDNYGNSYDITETDNGRITFIVPAQFDGEISIKFIEPWYWRLSEAISVVMLVACVAYLLVACNPRKKYS